MTATRLLPGGAFVAVLTAPVIPAITLSAVVSAVLKRKDELLVDCYDVDDNPAGETLSEFRLAVVLRQELAPIFKQTERLETTLASIRDWARKAGKVEGLDVATCLVFDELASIADGAIIGSSA